MNVAHYFKKAILKHKHLENILNILINNECDKIFSLPKEQRDFKLYNLLLNPMIMKAVISNCNGKKQTQDSTRFHFEIRIFAKQVKVSFARLRLASFPL